MPTGRSRTWASCGPATTGADEQGRLRPDGRFYCVSMAYDQRIGAGALYRLDLDGSMCVVLAYVVYRVSANTLRSRLRRCPP